MDFLALFASGGEKIDTKCILHTACLLYSAILPGFTLVPVILMHALFLTDMLDITGGDFFLFISFSFSQTSRRG